MKISILGTNGFLSTAIAKYAVAEGWTLEMYGLQRPDDHDCNLFHQVDLMDSEMDCSTLLDSDLIVYAIGAGIQANLKEGYNLIYNLNVTVPVAICNKLKELGYKGTFVTFGSVFEMGATTEQRFFSEKDVLTSLCPAPNDYTVSKRMLSSFVSSYKHDFTHWHFYIPTIYGAGENPKRLIPYVVNAIRNGEELHFTAGDQVRQYVHVSEVPRMLDLALKKKLASGLYNIEGSETLTVKEIVTKIHHAMGREVPEGCFGSVQRSDAGMKYLALDGTKLKDAIGFEAEKRIEESLKDY